MKGITMFAIAGLALVGLAMVKHVLDSLDDLASDNADWDRAALEGDGDLTLYVTGWPTILHGAGNTAGKE